MKTNVNKGKVSLAVSLLISTFVWSIGLTAFTSSVMAATTGDLITKAGSASVYYLGADGKRYVFSNQSVFDSWYGSYSTVKTVTNTELLSFELGGNVVARAGRLIQVVTNDTPWQVASSSVYAVSTNGTLHAIDSGATASSLFGSDWETRIVAVPESLFSNYKVGATLTSSSKIPDGFLAKTSGSTDTFLIEGGMKRAVSADGFTANMFKSKDVITTVLTSYSDGSALSGSESKYANVAGGASTGGATPVVGGLSVALASTSPASASVPINVDNIIFSQLNFTASNDAAVTVNAVSLHRSGLGADGDFASVTLYDGATKVGTSKTSFNSDHKMVFNISGGWVIPAGTTKTLTVKAKLDTSGTYNALGIVSASDVSLANGTVAGSYPVYGHQMTGVTISALGSVTVTGEGTDTQTKNIGETGVQLAAVKLEAGSGENLKLKRLVLKNIGTAKDSTVSSITLKKGGTTLAGPVSMVDDYITFDLSASPLVIEKSGNVSLKVMGDIMDDDASNIEFVLKDDTDIEAVGDIYNVNVTVVRTGLDATGDSGTTVTTVDGSELNISLSSANIDTPNEVTNFEFGRINFSAGKAVKITDIILTLDETDGDSAATNNRDIDDLELVDAADGTAYSLTMSGGGDTDADDETWTMSSEEIAVNPGKTTTLIVRGDIPSETIGNGDQYNIAWTINTTNLIAETIVGGDSVDTFSVSSVTGKKVTVKSSTLKVRSTALQAGDVVIGAKNTVLFAGKLEAGSASAITVERLDFEGNSGTGTNIDVDNLTRAVLVSIINGVEKEEQVIASGLTDEELNFNELSILVPAGKTIDFEVRADIVGANLTANTTLYTQLEVVTAKDDDNDAVTATNEAGTAIANTTELTTARNITLRASGALAISINNADAGVNKDRVTLAGSAGILVGKIKLVTYYESIKLRDLTLTNGTVDVINESDEDSVKQVCLHSDSTATTTNKVGCTTLGTNDLAFFDEIGYTVPKGTNYLYVFVDTTKVGNGAADTADSHDIIQFFLDDDIGSDLDVNAEGVDSGVALADGDNDSTIDAGEVVFDNGGTGTGATYDQAGDVSTAATKAFEIAANAITAVSLVSSYSTTNVATAITGTGTYNLAILKVVAPASTNTDANGDPLKLTLDNLSFDVTKFATTMALSGATIERIGGSIAAQDLVEANGALTAGDGAGNLTIDADTLLTTDAVIEANSTAYFLVKGTISALSAVTGNTNWIQVDLNTLNDTAASTDGDDNLTNNIDFFDGSDATINYEFLRLDYTDVDGTKISAAQNN